ncbi:MAG: DUF4157 domain-containing protein [Candidatus Nealsonbacteria bacterium]|nr:DUF4157 domain-containing protein [Candidatus Nealsonbacteria bacterium]
MKIERLDEKTQEILKPWYPDLDLNKVKLVRGGIVACFFAKFFNAGAVTIGRNIYFPNKSRQELWLFVHELKHVEQYEKLGVGRFLLKYIFDWARAGFKYSANLPLEAPAYKIQKEFLEKTKGV